MEDALQFGGRREVLQRVDRTETTATAPQRDAHEERRRREAEHERSDVGLPRDAERPEEPEEAFESEEDHDDVDDGEGRDPGEWQEQGNPAPRVEPPVRAEGRENSSRCSDEQDPNPEVHEQEDEGPNAPPTKYTIAHLPLPIRSSKVGEIRISPRRFRKMCVSEACTNSNVIHVHGAGAEPRAAARPRSETTGEDRTNPNEEVATWSA